MFRRILFIAPLVLLFLAVIYLYFGKSTHLTNKDFLYETIPAQYPIALESENWHKVFSAVDSMPYKLNIVDQKWFLECKHYFNYIKELKLLLNETESVINTQKTLFAFGNAGNMRLGALAAFKIPKNISITNLLASCEAANYKIKSKSFEGVQIAEIKDLNSVPSMFVTLVNNTIVLSKEESNIEEVLMKGLREEANKEWLTLSNEIGAYKNVLMYINAEKLSYLAGLQFTPDGKDIYKPLSESVKKVMFEIQFFSKELTAKGYAIMQDNVSQVKPVYVEKTPSMLAPINTSSYKQMSLQAITNPSFEEKTLQSLFSSYCQFKTIQFSLDQKNNVAILSNIEDKNLYQNLKEVDEVLDTAKVLGDYAIFYTKKASLFNHIFNTDIFNGDTVYASQINKDIILSSNLSLVEQYLSFYSQDKLLEKQEDYISLTKNIKKESASDWYVDFTKLQTYLSQISITTWNSIMDKMLLQFFPHKNNIQSSLAKITLAQHEKNSINRGGILWTKNIEKPMKGMLSVAKNHVNNELEILFQDTDNNIVKYSRNGNFLWKVNLKEDIKGHLKQIDYYNNQKLQCVFNTLNQIHILDINGSTVDGFPLKLPDEATNEMVVFDYDKVKDYRYFVSCSNKNVYGFKKDGKPLEGWNPLSKTGLVSLPLKHVLIGSKDYIYFVNDSGTFYALNRKGEERFAPVKADVHFKSPFFTHNTFFVGGVNGTLFQIDLKGALSKKNICANDFNIFDLITLPNKAYYVFANTKECKLFNEQYNVVMSYIPNFEIEAVSHLVENSKLWIHIKGKNTHALVDINGIAHPDSPFSCADILFKPIISSVSDMGVLINNQEQIIELKELRWPIE